MKHIQRRKWKITAVKETIQQGQLKWLQTTEIGEESF